MNAEKAPFVAMAKPVGSKCNLRCGYCYYLGTDERIDNGCAAVMDDETLDCFIRRYIGESTGPAVSFTWHGGEPTLAGLDFFKKCVALQKKYLPAGWECWNNLQTNGVLLDEEWCAFLAKERFDVGLSIDGAKPVHDKYRKNAAGAETYDEVYAAAKRLVAHGVRPDLLCTVTSDSAENPLSVYRALRELGTGWVQFIPIVRRDENGDVTPDSVTPEGYGKFLCDIFDEWIYHDLGKTGVQFFLECALVLSGGSASLCWMAPVCGRVLVTERDGGVYACDHFVDSDHRLGSVQTDGLRALVDSERQAAFGNAKREKLTAQCRACPHLALCNGGCMKDRFARSADGEEGHAYLCAGLKAFFDHAVPRLKTLAQLQRAGLAPGAIMERLRAQELQRWKGIGRNDPCPCGSGKKAKNCCWDKKP